ncbi:MAG: L,D-transpeptidase, partial [Bradyrhizobium sp.]
GYIYPADGSVTDQRYPAPRRRVYDAQAYPQQQYQYYNNPGDTPQYAPPQGYYQQRQYYQPR